MKRKAMAVKFLDEEQGIIGGWGAPFGGPFAGKDVQGDFFTPATDFCLDWFGSRPVLYHHGVDETKGAEICGIQTRAEIRDAGLWVECQLNKAQKYWDQIEELIKRGVLYFSSGAIPQLAARKSTGEITRWPIMEISLTPTPANPLASITMFKAIANLKAVGIPDEDLAAKGLVITGDPAAASGDTITNKDGDMKKATKSEETPKPEKDNQDKPVEGKEAPDNEAPKAETEAPPAKSEEAPEEAAKEAADAPKEAGEGTPQLPAEVVKMLVALKESCDRCLSGQKIQEESPAEASAPAPAPAPEGAKAVFDLDLSSIKAQLDGIATMTSSVTGALKRFEERLAKIEAQPAGEGPVLRDVKSVNPRMDIGESESATISRLAQKATDPNIKLWLEKQAGEESIKEIIARGPQPPVRGYRPDLG